MTKVRRELPTDPAELDRVLAGPRVEFSGITELVDQFCTVLPPKLPLLPEEKARLTEAGARWFYSRDKSLNPGWFVLLSLLAVAGSRVLLVKQGFADVGPELRRKLGVPLAADAPKAAAA